jgi:hypothetical protein
MNASAGVRSCSFVKAGAGVWAFATQKHQRQAAKRKRSAEWRTQARYGNTMLKIKGTKSLLDAPGTPNPGSIRGCSAIRRGYTRTIRIQGIHPSTTREKSRFAAHREPANPSSNPRYRSCLVLIPEHKIFIPVPGCALTNHPTRRFFNVSGGLPPSPPCLTTFIRLFSARASAAAPF